MGAFSLVLLNVAAHTRKKRLRPVLLAATLLLLLVASLLLPVEQYAFELASWLRELGVLGVVLYALAYTIGALLLVPGAALTLGAGFAYGAVYGALLAIPSVTLASAVVFLLARSVLRHEVERRFAARPAFIAIERAVAKHGLKTVVLLRLSPVMPFNVLNYAFGLSRLSFPRYVVATMFGVSPGALLYAYLGSSVTSASQLAHGQRPSAGAFELVLYWAGLLATIVVVVVLGRLARRELRAELAEAEQSATSENVQRERTRVTSHAATSGADRRAEAAPGEPAVAGDPRNR